MRIDINKFWMAILLLFLAGTASCTKAPVNQQDWLEKRQALATICLTAPQSEIHTAYELDEIKKRVSDENVHPEDLKGFLIFMVKVRLGAVKAELSRFSNLVEMVELNLPPSALRQKPNSLESTFAKAAEMPTITSQLLERELLALEIWVPGMTAEQALARADQQRTSQSKRTLP